MPRRAFHVSITHMKTARPYVMTSRAESAARTGERILDSAIALFWEQPTDRLSLDEVARRADVSVQTVIRRFGGKDGLLVAAGQREAERIGVFIASGIGGFTTIEREHLELIKGGPRRISPFFIPSV